MDRSFVASTCLACTFLVFHGACGDDVAGSASATMGASNTSATTAAPTTGGTGSATGEAPTTSVGGSDSASDATTHNTTGDPTTSTSTSTTSTATTSTTADDPSTSTTSTSTGGVVETTTDASTSSTTGDTTGGGPKLDMGGSQCEIKCGNTDWSYVWIANSGEHTISKIDTRTMTEEGRYRTRPDHLGNPSRTSVSIDGKAVAVANRSGGLTKIWAREEFCEDKNGNGVIDTSTGKFDVRPFAEDECIAWYTAFPAAISQRPVAWTSGVYNEQTCEYEDQKIWTASANGNGGIWPCDGSPGIFVYRVNGDTGVVEDTLHLPDVPCGGTLGPYGAAVDSNNDLWMYIWSASRILHVEYDTLNYELIQGGSYGITVDKQGRVWVDSGRRYDPVTKQWAQQIGNQPGNGGSGVAEDLQGRIWKATPGGVGWVDSNTMLVGDTVLLPNPNLARGIGVDVDGYIWAVILGGTQAFRIDPDTYEIAEYNGLNQPYTYSDMAGGQINQVICPQ
ncbi:MAG TPA: hypothetical protein VIK91_23105 [Nannocystis sp.]